MKKILLCSLFSSIALPLLAADKNPWEGTYASPCVGVGHDKTSPLTESTLVTVTNNTVRFDPRYYRDPACTVLATDVSDPSNIMTYKLIEDPHTSYPRGPGYQVTLYNAEGAFTANMYLDRFSNGKRVFKFESKDPNDTNPIYYFEVH